MPFIPERESLILSREVDVQHTYAKNLRILKRIGCRSQGFPEKGIARFRKEASILRTETFGSHSPKARANDPPHENVWIAQRNLCPPTRELCPPTRQLCPPTRELYFPTRELCPPTRELCPSTRGLCPPTPELCPLTRELCPPTRELCPPTREQIAPTREICPPTRELIAPTRELCPPTRQLRHGSCVLRHESRVHRHVATGISTFVSTTCTRNWETRQQHDLHLWNLHAMHNQDVGHIVNELQLWNLNGHLNSQDQKKNCLTTTEMSKTIKELQLRSLCKSTLSNSKHLLLTTTGMSAACPRIQTTLRKCTACITGDVDHMYRSNGGNTMVCME